MTVDSGEGKAGRGESVWFGAALHPQDANAGGWFLGLGNVRIEQGTLLKILH